MDNQDQPTADQAVDLQGQINRLKSERVHQQDIVPGAIKPKHLAPATSQAKGDTYYSNGTDFVKTSIGATGQILTVNSGVPTWAAAPTTPKQTTLYDSNGNIVIATQGATGPANLITASNSATGHAPSFTASGTDTNIDLSLIGKGSGASLLTVQRQGGSATDWTVTGTTQYTPSGTLIQCGTIGVGTTSNVTLTFPQAYSNPPVVTISIQNSSGCTIVIKSVSASQVVFAQGASADATSVAYWIAIGPR